MLLEKSVNPDVVNRYKQAPLMLAAMHGKISCVKRLIEAGANILMFDSLHGRTCSHYAAYYGHFDCLQAILSAAQSSQVAVSCFPGSTPLHLAAKGGSLNRIRKLLAWGADHLQRDASGRIPYVVALKYKHGACAALLNPSSAEPLVWPAPLKFISELNSEAKSLLEQALMEANREREKNILKQICYSLPSHSPSHSESGLEDTISEVNDSEVCCICFEQICTIEVQDCGHQMCAKCTLALCCHNNPNPTTASVTSPVCPFCRSTIVRLVVAKIKDCYVADHEIEVSSPKLRKPRKSMNFSEGSSSFKSLSAVGSFNKMGRIGAENEWMDKQP